ncbi:hypothetical protein MMC16_001680 [Acarospora aff. strigata]|nr:hypothetical protein [Acarospora aff. strigata]
MAASVTPPPLQGPSSKEKKYDRQLRLWAASGQQALEEAHVLLVNSGPGVAGVEALKNLILPGVGNFTVVDDATPFESLLERPDVLTKYSHILITAPITRRTLSNISEYAWEHSIPLFYIHCVGFYSQFSVQLPPQYPIVDTHPDPTSTQDLRLLSPWPELSKYAAKTCGELETLSDHDHGHVPYLLLLLHYLEKWKASHAGQYPGNYKEKTAFRDLVRAGARAHNVEGGEENYDEAVGAVLKSLNPPSLSSGVRDVLSVEDCTTPTSHSANFWIIAHAIRSFHETHSVLPLPGSVPDMKAQSSDYITLQNMYKAKARQDLTEVLHTVRAIETRLGRTTAIEEKEIEAFCKNAASVKLIHGRKLHIPDAKAHRNWPADTATALLTALHDQDSLLPISIALLAYDHFYNTHSRTPGQDDDHDHDDDLNTMTRYTDAILSSLTSTSTDDKDKDNASAAKAKTAIRNATLEILRAGGGEMHNIAALTGGMVAQEVIKVVTKQYVPVDNRCVFDGIGSRSAVSRL